MALQSEKMTPPQTLYPGSRMSVATKNAKIKEQQEKIAALEYELKELRESWGKHKNPLSTGVPPEPARLRAMYGLTVTTSTDKYTWNAYHTMPWNMLSAKTQNQYLKDAFNALEHSGYEPPKIKEPLALANFMLAAPIDIWEIVKEVTNPEVYSVAQRNNYAKALLGILNARVRECLPGEKDERTCALWSTVVQRINHSTKMEVGEVHRSQIQSAASKANTEPWENWVKQAEEFITTAFKPINAFEQKRDGMIVALYSKIPPIRNNWCDVEICKETPKKNDTRNCLVLRADGAIDTYWGHFKNSASFKEELPLHLPVTSKPLIKLLRKYLPLLNGGKWLLPKHVGGEPIAQDSFSTHIAALTQKIVKKNFTCQRMRISYITHWHELNPGKANVKKLQAHMRLLHQKDIAVNLSYDKLLDSAIEEDE